MLNGSSCQERSPAKGVWQKSDKKVTEASETVTEKWPEVKKSDETRCADLLMWQPEMCFQEWPYPCVPPCVAKTCVVRPVFARVAGELGAADPRMSWKGR